MRKSHLALFIMATIMCLSSAYSLAAINQVYKVDFEWYSEYSKAFISEKRDLPEDKWILPEYPEQKKFKIYGSNEEFINVQNVDELNKSLNVNFNRYILLYCSLGKVYSPEYRVKVLDIAQRGTTVEVKVNLNSPQKVQQNYHGDYLYFPFDVVKIDRDAFPIKGKLFFIIKSQNGDTLSEQIVEID